MHSRDGTPAGVKGAKDLRMTNDSTTNLWLFLKDYFLFLIIFLVSFFQKKNKSKCLGCGRMGQAQSSGTNSVSCVADESVASTKKQKVGRFKNGKKWKGKKKKRRRTALNSTWVKKPVVDISYCTFQRCVDKLYAMTLTRIAEFKMEQRGFFLILFIGFGFIPCVSQQVPLPHTHHPTPPHPTTARGLASTVTLTLTCSHIVPTTRRECLQGDSHPRLSYFFFSFFFSFWVRFTFSKSLFLLPLLKKSLANVKCTAARLVPPL